MRTVKQLNTHAQNKRGASISGLKIGTSVLTMTVLACLTACGQAKWQETKSSHTGDPVIEHQVAPPRTGSLEPGSTGYVSSDRLRGLNTPDQNGEDAPVVLEKNDTVEVMDPTPQGPDEMVKVRPRNTQSPATPHGPIFVPKAYLADKPMPVTTEDISADRYLVIENVATETLRVYERCTEAPGCANKLLLETDMVVGQDTPNHELRTRTGVYRIENWVKFYEDNERLYPSWMAPGAPAMPGAGQPLNAWTTTSLIPQGYSNDGARAAFGWYTAKIGPNAGEQWTHGTWGMGADGDKFIQAVRRMRNDERLESHGCTRVENQAISLMHELLPAGTKVIKVYAREALADESYATQNIPRRTWDWVMTSDDAGKTGRKMSASIARSGRIMDQGRYAPENHAHVQTGNVYGVPENEMVGVFLVDQGRMQNYKNPAAIPHGGFGERNILPSAVIARGQAMTEQEAPLPPRRPEGNETQRAVPVPPVRVQTIPAPPVIVRSAPVRQQTRVVPVAPPVVIAQPKPQPRPQLPPVVKSVPVPAARPAPPIVPSVALTPPSTVSTSQVKPAARSIPTVPTVAIPAPTAPKAKPETSTSSASPVPAASPPPASGKSSGVASGVASGVSTDDPIADTGSATINSIPVPHRPLKKNHAVQN